MPYVLKNRVILHAATAITLSLGFVSLSAGQSNSADKIMPETDKTPEEIVVYGEKSVIVLQNELYRAEESFFDLFNSLNSNDELDVKCAKEQTGIAERRKEHRCLPRFALKAAGQAGSGFARGMGYGLPKGAAYADFDNLQYQARVRAMEKKMWAEVVELAKSNPEFLEEIKNLQRANQALDAEKQR